MFSCLSDTRGGGGGGGGGGCAHVLCYRRSGEAGESVWLFYVLPFLIELPHATFRGSVHRVTFVAGSNTLDNMSVSLSYGYLYALELEHKMIET